jgi:hypothetical protein
VTGSDAGRWSDAAWRAAIEAWIRAELAATGRSVIGPIEQPHSRPWSTTLRIQTDLDVVWAKASGPGTAHEGPLLQAFVEWNVPFVLAPLGVDVGRRLLLLPDGGTTLRRTRPDDKGDQDLGAWERVLADYATLQRAVEPRAGELLRLGVPDGRPEVLQATLARLVADDAIWARVDATELDTAAARERLRGLGPWVERRAGVLSGSGITFTIQHDDLHSNNVFAGPDGYRFFDWGDSVVAHPFGTLLGTLNSVAYHLGSEPGAPELRRLRDAYLEAWTDVLPRAALDEVLEAALDLGRIGKAAAWDRALMGLETAEMDGHGDAPAAWLMDLDQHLEGRGAP